MTTFLLACILAGVCACVGLLWWVAEKLAVLLVAIDALRDGKLRAALELARDITQRGEAWHVVVNYPEQPERTLGDVVTEALR